MTIKTTNKISARRTRINKDKNKDKDNKKTDNSDNEKNISITNLLDIIDLKNQLVSKKKV